MHPSKTFCIHPFTRLVTREDGAIKPCCRSEPIGWIQNETLESAWNNDNMKRVRNQLLNNINPVECNSCVQLEKQGVASLRSQHNDLSFINSSLRLYGDTISSYECEMPYEFPILEIKLNNLCNLKCRMCSPLDSTSWDDWNEIKEFYQAEGNYLSSTISELGLESPKYVNFFNENWWDSFYKVLPYLQVIEFGGGEPLMDPQHYEILELLLPYANKLELRYATNGTTLGISQDRTIFKYWPQFKSVIVNVSIDGIFDVYEYIRTNSKFNTIQNNIMQMKQISSVSRVVGKFTLQGANALQMAECVEYFIETLGIPFFAHRVSYPNVLSAQVLPVPLKELAISRLTTLLEKLSSFNNLNLFNINIEEITRKNILDSILYLQGNDQSSKIDQFIKFNSNLDNIRNQGPITAIIPELLPYV